MGVVGLNPTTDMVVCLQFFCVCVILYKHCSGVITPFKESARFLVIRFVNLESGRCRALLACSTMQTGQRETPDFCGKLKVRYVF